MQYILLQYILYAVYNIAVHFICSIYYCSTFYMQYIILQSQQSNISIKFCGSPRPRQPSALTASLLLVMPLSSHHLMLYNLGYQQRSETNKIHEYT
jgi:hypothetical protein